MAPLILAALFGVLFMYASVAPPPSMVPGPFDPVRFMAAEENSVRALVTDPESVRFRKNAVSAEVPVVCGEINVRNGANAYVGFRRFVSGPEIRKLEDATSPDDRKSEYAFGRDEMDRLWLSHCANAK
jgi:hypothetical protein